MAQRRVGGDRRSYWKVGSRTIHAPGHRLPNPPPEMRPGETPWYTPTLKRSENASRPMVSKSPPVSHLRANPSSKTPYRVLSCNDTATVALPADS